MALVELGNHAPSRKDGASTPDGRPAVTYISVPDIYSCGDDFDAAEFKMHLANSLHPDPSRSGITSRPDHEAIVSIVHPGGAWAAHSKENPRWVWSDDPSLQKHLAAYWGCAEGRPSDDLYHETYWRRVGTCDLAPGVRPAAVGVDALLTNVGRAIWGNALGGGSTGYAGTATASSATTLTMSGASWTINQWAGYRVYAGTVWGNVVSNTATVLTVDQWYAVPDTGSAGSTPSSTAGFVIASGGSVAAWYMGITSTNITPAATDTSLSGEQTTNGLARKISVYSLTSGTSPATFTLTVTYTYTGSSSLTLYAIGLFVSNVKTDTTDTMVFETSLNASATVNNSGDQVTVTDTCTGS